MVPKKNLSPLSSSFSSPLWGCSHPVSEQPALEKLAGELATTLEAGSVLALEGPLGAGKTTFVQALAKALGVDETVQSPTFSLLHHYSEGRLPLLHIDFYRLGSESSERLRPEVEEWIQRGEAVLLIEWAQYAAAWLEPWLTHRLIWIIEPSGERTLTCETLMR
jgi:tRNA threonylcarbamoyladenosine biosynthesis protein TsaE